MSDEQIVAERSRRLYPRVSEDGCDRTGNLCTLAELGRMFERILATDIGTPFRMATRLPCSENSRKSRTSAFST